MCSPDSDVSINSNAWRNFTMNPEFQITPSDLPAILIHIPANDPQKLEALVLPNSTQPTAVEVFMNLHEPINRHDLNSARRKPVQSEAVVFVVTESIRRAVIGIQSNANRIGFTDENYGALTTNEEGVTDFTVVEIQYYSTTNR